MAPLTGINVVEAANFIAGPYAGMILADLGASVIKVEAPRGDPYRRFGAVYGDSSLAFRATNQRKSGVVLDLKTDDGMNGLHALLADADVFITNWRPSVAPGLGLTADAIRRRYPKLIWVRVSGYGQDGPRSDLPAYDGIIQARSGAAISGRDTPINTNNNIADKVSAMFAAQTATAALLQREHSGEGSICDVAMVDALAHFYGADISSGHRMVGAAPDLGVGTNANSDATFRSSDGFVTVSPVTGRQIRRALEAAGVGDAFSDVMSADPSEIFQTFANAISPALRTRTGIEWEEAFAAADVPAAAVRDFTDHIADPQTVHNRVYQQVTDPSIGEWLIVRFPALFDGEPCDAVSLAAPALDRAGPIDG